MAEQDRFCNHISRGKQAIVFLVICLSVNSLISQNITNVGTDFWIAFPPNNAGGGNVQLFISSNFTTSGNVVSAYPGVNQTFNVTPGVVTQFGLPAGVQLVGGTESKGIMITSADPIAVYGLIYQTATTDAFMALPVPGLGLDYTVMTYKVTVSPSCFSIVATQDGTSLTIFNHQTNATSNVTLDLGQTYHVKASLAGEDLTGSRIQSNNPVAVFGSNNLVNVPEGCTFADYIVEQMFPVNSWGQNFVTVPLAGRDNSGDVFRILAASDGTTVTINGTMATTLNTGDFYETNLTGYNVISTSNPALLAQFAKGKTCTGNITGDPFMMLIFPQEQFLTNYTIVNLANFDSHWVNVVAPGNAIGAIYQDGIIIPPAAFIQIGTTNFYGAQRSVTVGSHTFNSTFPFGVFVYGWTNVNSYGYPGGGSLSPVATVDSISISPDTLYGQLNVTIICLTAHVLDNLGNPVEGVLVNFNISGINPILGNAYTNSSGDAQYCYTQTGTTPGVDQVYAEILGILSDTAIVYWSYIPPCINPVSGGTIGNDQTGCGSYLPSPLVNTTLPTGQTGSLEYKWQYSIVSSTTGFIDIPGSNADSYVPGIISQTTWYKRLARVSCMADWSGAVESNFIKLTVNPVLIVNITVSASDNDICAGTLVTFTATPVNGGNSPQYQWKVNGANVGTNNPVYSYNPINGDQVWCVLTSSEVCTSGNPASSIQHLMVVNNSLPASVSIAASSNPFCKGTIVSYTATPTNGGTNPAYQWKVNGNNVGINSAVFSFSPQSGDSIWCIMTSNLYCVSANPASSNKIGMISNPLPVVTFTYCFDSVTKVNAKSIKLKGGIPLGGIYSGPGVNSTTGVFTPSIAGTGTKKITYSYTNFTSCSASKTKTIIVQINPSFTCGNNLTDIRDNKVYPTVQIGSQCWMATNLNFGNRVPSAEHQRDNCTPEKYCYNELTANCEQRGANYQWDELMRYDDTPGLQGLCPPGWHVPTETDWNTLFANWTNNGFAGSPLKYSGYSGFNAILSGIRSQNVQWNLQDFATFYWSSTPQNAARAWSHGMNDPNPSISLYSSLRSNAFPVRCLRD
jgi:uncharacterized protein (TIGR02145 family)